MMNEERKPQEYDVVLGGNNSPPLDGLVLGGIEGVKRRFDKANSEEDKITLLKEALKYSEVGEDWLFEILETKTGDILWESFNLLWKIFDDNQRQQLIKYFPKLIKDDVHKWNIWRIDNPNIQLDLSNTDFYKANLSCINLSNINLSKSNFIQANLSNSNLSNSNLSWANLSEAILNHTDLSFADLSNTYLMNSELYYANLDRANFHNSILTGSNLSWGKLNNTKFKNADLSWANLTKANLYNANLTRANLYQSNLTHVVFQETNISWANFEGANIDRVHIREKIDWDYYESSCE
ncbi:Pentapeptide repeat family protein [Hyella patelloides LEGE 07179]|uniref:Pentapeptide repeat family protein n=1 Tax=Hyella patelloides LEGE 07179 TaxID=945734 RepID=A0A563VP26_9CYAN|nr:pentapeptide repeat-containing protein [Hyella patelloides]VEP13183.1 Pentapeptide repeat family protein [Hyella patelloides LEGE 07179]